MPASGFEPVIPDIEWTQVNTFDNMATVIDIRIN
jgi:hypothetical protein